MPVLMGSTLGNAIDFFVEGEIAMMEENDKVAIKNLYKALKLYPQSPTIYNAIGEVYQHQNDYYPKIWDLFTLSPYSTLLLP